ncbi:MAG: DNA-binding domain-containing protein, partial [Candidatus Methylomirabilis sp.]|nr:DNA-binding domain-containing protein [Deltaproteobacteria bacterium]
MRLDELGRRVRELCLAEDPSHALVEGYLGVASPERAAVYRRLVRGVLLGTLENCFPVLRRALGEEDWGRLAAEFLARRPPATPIVREVPADFVRFLEETPHPLEAGHPYL